MARFALRSSERQDEFAHKYIPRGTIWRECDPCKNPYADVLIKDGTYPIIRIIIGVAELNNITGG